MTKVPKQGEVFDGLEVGPVDEREHSAVPGVWEAVRERLERYRAERAEESAEPKNTAMRDFLQESGDAVPVADPVEEADLGLESTLVAFRRRHGLPADTVLTARLVAEVVAARERGRERRAFQADPFES